MGGLDVGGAYSRADFMSMCPSSGCPGLDTSHKHHSLDPGGVELNMT